MLEWWGPIIHEYYAGTEDVGSPGHRARGVAGPSRARWVDRSRRSTSSGDDGDELPVGEAGTVYFAGGREFEYHNDPEKTARIANDRGGARSATSATSTRTATST